MYYICSLTNHLTNFWGKEASFLFTVFSDEACLISELDALGDELLADEDSSYLDEAASAPAIPEGVPTDTKNKDGVLVDEFGLPQLPAS